MAFDAGLPVEQKKPLDFGAFLKVPPPDPDWWEIKARYESYQPPPGFDLALLKIARERMARGWTKRALHDNHGVCAVGALLSAVQNNEYPTPATMDQDLTVERLARHIDGMSASELMSLNDQRMTNKNFMLAMFDRAIKRLEAKVFGERTNAATSTLPSMAQVNPRSWWLDL